MMWIRGVKTYEGKSTMNFLKSYSFVLNEKIKFNHVGNIYKIMTITIFIFTKKNL